MNKVIRAELKKAVSKPGIYVLAILLALILVLGVFIYKPKDNSNNEIVLNKTTVLENCTDFFGDGVTSGYKLLADTKVENASALLGMYTIDNTSYKTKITALFDDFKAKFKDYKDCAYLEPAESYVQQTKTKMLDSFKTFYDTINAGLNKSDSGAYPIVTTKKNYDNLSACYSDGRQLLKADTTSIADTCDEFANTYLNKIEENINKFYYPSIDKEKVNDYTAMSSNTKRKQLEDRTTAILAEINEIKFEAQADNNYNTDTTQINALQLLINKYVDSCAIFENLIKYDLMSNALKTAKVNDRGNLLYLNNTNLLDTDAWLIKYEYLFKNNKTINDYATPLTIGRASNGGANGYDYAYFSLKLFSFVIIAYAIMAGANAIAGEVKEGTMRYLAIRPVSRKSILFGKLFAIAIMASILTVFSGIISVLVGGFIYGFKSATILTIFAGKYAITLHPIAMLAIYLLSAILEMLVYLSIAMMLSTLLKSDILTVTLVMVLYLINVLLPVFAMSNPGWLAYYPFSHISLYSLFGSTLYANANNTFNLLFGAKAYPTSSLWLTLLVIALVVAVCSFIASKVFKHKEI